MAALHIDHKQFEELMKSGGVTLVDFWAPWCKYCVRINDAYDQIAEQYGDKLNVVKVNIDDNEALAQQENIEVIPTLVLYREGQAVGSIVAPESKTMIEAFIGETTASVRSFNPVHDMVIVGGGPAGYTAALYAARGGLDSVVIERLSVGGQMALTHKVDNYPGFANGIDGLDLALLMQEQAHRFDAMTEYADVTRLDLKAQPKVIETSDGTFYAKTVVLAMGANPRELGIEGEAELKGRGVAYCAACDGMFYKDKKVVVVGGGNSAAADALLLSRVAREVILVHRRDTLRADKIERDPLMRAKNVSFRWDSVVEELLHGDRLTGVRIRNVKTGEISEIACDGLFVSIGRKPATALVQGQLELDAAGYIVADESTKTSLPGVYAVGDVRTKALRQVVTAVADGAVAAHMAQAELGL